MHMQQGELGHIYMDFVSEVCVISCWRVLVWAGERAASQYKHEGPEEELAMPTIWTVFTVEFLLEDEVRFKLFETNKEMTFTASKQPLERFSLTGHQGSLRCLK